MTSRFCLFSLLIILVQSVPAESTKRTVLKVCTDPHNLPYSNIKEEGFENKIATLIAEKLGLPLKYAWFPQRMGFIRHTLKGKSDDGAYKCDLVIGVPDRFELADTTLSYYASTYAFVYAKGRGLDGLLVPDDISKLTKTELEKIRIAVFDRGPAQL